MLHFSLRRLWVVLLLVLGLGAASLASVAPALSTPLLDPFNLSRTAFAQDKSLVWQRFDVDITVNPDGTFDVCEEQTIRFTEGSFTFGYRNIPFTNFGEITNWSVTDSSGRAFEESFSREPGTFVVEQGSQYEVYWYFDSMRNETGAWTLCYTVRDGLRYYAEGDQLWWKAVYGDRAFPVEASRVIVNLPPGAMVEEWAAYINGGDARSRVTADAQVGARSVTFNTLDRLFAGEELEVRVQFTEGVVAGAPQSWQASADAAAAARTEELNFINRWQPIATLGLCGLGVALALGGPAGLYALWYRRGRNKPVPMVADYLPEPPDELPPGLAGTLLDESADMEDILATLVDLARRKAVSITEVREDSLWAKKLDFIYRRERSDVPLLDYERELLDAVFGRKDEVRLSDLKNKFYSHLPALRTALYEEAVRRGLFPSNPSSTRTAYVVLGVFMLVIAAAVGFGSLMTLGWLTPAAIAPGIGLGIMGLGVLIIAQAMPRKTDAGAEAAARWKAFRTYLQNIDKYSDLQAQKEIWDRWLPYAIAFKVDREYIRRFAAIDAPSPGWYIPNPTLYGPWRGWYYGGGPDPRPSMGGMGNLGGGGPGGSGGSGGSGGGLSDASRGMGGGLTAMSAGFGTMLSSAASTMASQPQSSSGGGGWGGGGFSGGGGFGGGGGGGGGGGFG